MRVGEEHLKGKGGYAMDLKCQTQEAIENTSLSMRPKLRASDEPRILIVCADNSIAERLNLILGEAGLSSECVKTITAGCEFAKTGRFQVVLTTPFLGDGSWRRLVDIASHYDLGFVVILMAGSFNFDQRAEAFEDGVFDVLDALRDLPKIAETTKRALWAAYLKGFGPGPGEASSPKAA
jgi:DNA-binding NtrC family response regulator